MKTRVVIVDDHAAIRQMLAIMLPREGAYEVVGEASTGFEGLRICELTQPDLVILDLLLPELNGVTMIERLHVLLPEARLMVFSGAASRSLLVEALRARPHGFVHKTDDWSVFREALRAVMGRASYLTPFATRLLDAQRGVASNGSMLSPRERGVLQMVAEGLSSKQIADKLHIAPKTVEHYRAQLMDKLDLHDVASLTRHAVRLGLVTVEVEGRCLLIEECDAVVE